ncbi:hypothetical protein FRC06_002482 [Ceratobasidium sp. 370]|nr:hypothetical protein FRC06_002482 [Ceratobasidium sp. 370]
MKLSTSSSNGFDFLGLVLFQLAQVVPSQLVEIEQFVLECLSFTKSHTGVNLAKTIYLVLCKFHIEHRVWGIVCDNASHSAAMMDKLVKMGLLRLHGASCCLMCILHIYNLAAKATTLPFHVQHTQLEAAAKKGPDDGGESEDDDKIADLPADEDNLEDHGTAPSANLEWVGDKGDELPDIVPGSAEDEECWQVTKALWKKACEETDMPKLHSIRWDVQTHWNLTELTLKDANRIWLGLTAYQQNEKYTPRKERFMPKDHDAIRRLLTVLRPLHLATEAMSKVLSPSSLTSSYYMMSSTNILNEYCQKSDEWLLYRPLVLLHPSMRAHHMNIVEWEKEWIKVAVALLEESWRKFYRPTAESMDKTSDEPSVDTSFLGIMAYLVVHGRMLSSIDTTQQPLESLVDKFVCDTLAFNMVNSKHVPFNPLVWWYGQRVLGNERDGLTQLALDVLSAPASSMDVECVFSFAGSIATATLCSYSKAGLVKPGTLQVPLCGREKAKEGAKVAKDDVLPPTTVV